jgi:hypothetical protein
MKGKASIFFFRPKALRACLLLCCLPLAAAGQVIIQRGMPGQVIINGGLMNGGALMFNNGFWGTPTGKPERMPEPRGDVLEFVDGSALHGTLARMDLALGLTWAAPEASQPISFHPAHFDFIRFAHAQPVSMTPTCHLWFANGDDLYGAITSMDDQRLGFSTWFGGNMVIPRKAVRAITFLSANHSVLYDGPFDLGGWLVVNNGSWTFRGGAFLNAGMGTLGRDLNLTNSATMEFDLAWSNPFRLEVGLYCDAVDTLAPNGGSCVVYVTPQQISLREIQNVGLFNMAGVPVPGGEGKNRMHVAIECDKAEGTTSVFVNHLLAKTWKDCTFAGGGTGVLFMQSDPVPGAIVKVSHLKISQWADWGEEQTSVLASNTDAIHFVNHDQTAGKIESIQNGKVRLALAGTALDIPLERVTQVEFAQAAAPVESSGPWQVRAHFPGGGSLSFQLEKWDDKAVAGQSALFGSLAFRPGAIREMEFNLNRPKEEGVIANTKEFEELDE